MEQSQRLPLPRHTPALLPRVKTRSSHPRTPPCIFTLSSLRQMVELASKKFVCIVDETKLVSGLGGSKLAMPVEVTPFCYKVRARDVLCGGLMGVRRYCIVLSVCSQADAPCCALSVQLGAPDQAARDQGLHRQGMHARAARRRCASGVTDCCSLTPARLLQLRMKGDEIYVTDNANYIIDLYFETPMKDAVAAGNAISALVGVVEHGLFLNMCDVCIIAGKTGIDIKERKLQR